MIAHLQPSTVDGRADLKLQVYGNHIMLIDTRTGATYEFDKWESEHLLRAVKAAWEMIRPMETVNG